MLITVFYVSDLGNVIFVSMN